MSAWSEAFAELVRLVQPDVDPVLTKGGGSSADPTKELDQILLASARGVTWSTGLAVTYGQVVYPSVRMGRRFRVVTAGTTGATPPTWPDIDFASVTDNTVTYVEDGADSGSIYDVRRAARECWLLKQSKVSERSAYSADGRAFQEQQVFDQCGRMADRYASIGVV